VLWLPVPLVSVVGTLACLRVARESVLIPVAHRFWRHISVSLGFVGIGGIAQGVDVGTGTYVETLSPWTVSIYVAGVTTFLWALFRLPVGTRGRGRAERTTIWLDTWTVSVATGMFMWQLWTRVILDSAATSFDVALSLVLLALAMVGVLAVAKVALTAVAFLDRRALRALAVGLLVCSVSGSAEPLLDGRPHLNIGSLVVALAALTLTVAAERQRIAVQTNDVRTNPTGGRRPFSVLPYVAVAAVDALLLAIALRSGGHRDIFIIAAGVVVITGLVVLRQLTALRENASLLARLDAGLANIRTQERRFRSLVQNTSDLIAIASPDGIISYVSPGVQRVLGVPADDWIGASYWGAVHPDDRPLVRQRLARIASVPEGTAAFQVRLAHADGGWRWAEVICVNLEHEPGVAGIVFNARDVTDTHEFQDRLRHTATHDSLTGLANRVLFADRVESSLARSSADHRLGVVLIDLDNFKSVNDTLGHTVGDALLVAAAERLQASVRANDTVARLGGDEFAIVLDGMGPAEADEAVERLIACLNEPLFALGYELLIQASFGIADGRAGDSGPELLRHADVAMYVAKAQGDGRYMHYDPDMETRSIEHAQLAAELRQALENEQFRVVYQPIVELPGNRLTSVEALVRWQHPTRGVVQPADFIQAAERSGLILPLGRWVMRESCRQAASWRAEHGESAPGSVSVNVAARQLRDPGFADQVAETLTDAGLEPSRLTIEITETAAVGGGHTAQTLRALHELGVRLALDDFGTGHSSLSLLQDCPVDQLKLDRSFVSEQPGSLNTAAVAVIHMARALGLDAVAEGVETSRQSEELSELGYRRAQGFHFARPMAPAVIAALIVSGMPTPGAFPKG
jgi:diguanylate cyclase (GGDEF)-like protein/PAS domain S-box-containing protein